MTGLSRRSTSGSLAPLQRCWSCVESAWFAAYGGHHGAEACKVFPEERVDAVSTVRRTPRNPSPGGVQVVFTVDRLPPGSAVPVTLAYTRKVRLVPLLYLLGECFVWDASDSFCPLCLQLSETDWYVSLRLVRRTT